MVCREYIQYLFGHLCLCYTSPMKTETDTKKFVIRCRGIILHEGQLLVVRHSAATFVALPGGHLEWGEDVRECVAREIVEELGITPEIGRLLYINTFVDRDVTQPMEFFFEILNGKDFFGNDLRTGSHTHELEEILWIRPTDDIRILPQEFAEDFRAGKVGAEGVRYLKG